MNVLTKNVGQLDLNRQQVEIFLQLFLFKLFFLNKKKVSKENSEHVNTQKVMKFKIKGLS